MQPHWRFFPSGSVLFREGDAPTCAYLLESGSVEVVTTCDGKVRSIARLAAGALVGEMAVLDEAHRSATVRALSDCVCIPVERQQLLDRLDSADPIVRALLASQLSRYRAMLAEFRGLPVIDVAPFGAREGDGRAESKIRLESELYGALANGGLEVFLQPIARACDARIAGYEALVRWNHPQRGMVSPAEFIRMAEETSLIVPVGDYVLARTLDMLQQLHARGCEELPFIAINVSARQIDADDFLPHIADAVRRHRVPPSRLKLELTETLAMDPGRVRTLIARCHEIGVAVALDDFGAGFSNLGLLLDLPFDQVKLDAAFAAAVFEPRGEALVRAVAAMMAPLGCELVVEGVETAAQFERLKALGCDYVQGWWVGRPAPLAEVVAARG